MTELEQINEKLDKILALLQPKKELNASNSLDEVRGNINDGMPNPIDFRINANDFCPGWDYMNLHNGSLGFYDRRAYLKALEEWKANNNI